ncbi:DMT family transporter [Roseomonas marmotae]|uniref:DMT family transporter n=2 Tax=Roseomonas marmotae TaxID=2768161 RepID=A0ABS3KEB3_9PROT|nr:DMT family transporter [Roseomonas marmotae]MBO1075762.1 DMT family transporter [Roseomonas marmotae]QTI80865.1 DMT family transporter [Roseomonas marmotae]
MMAALGLFAVLDANSKILSGAYPFAQVVVIRHLTMLLLLLGGRLLRPGLGGPLGTAHPVLHLLRAAGMLGSAAGFFLALREMPMAEAYLVYFTAPFMTMALAALVLGEVPPRAAWLWCGVGFLGVAVAMAPGVQAGGSLRAYGFVLMGTVSYAMVMTINRRLRNESGVARLILWSALPGGLAMLPLALLDWRPPSGIDWLAMAANGVLAGAATIFLALAFRVATAARLAPLEFSALVWAVGLDVAIWGHWPSATAMAGAAIVIIACIMSQRVTRD